MSPPHVLVGHSYRGLLVRVYPTTYPSDVAGFVLVDPTHDNTRLSVQRRGDPQSTWVRVREGAHGLSIPEPRQANGKSSQTDGTYYWPDELEQLHQQRQANPVLLGDRPLIVLSGTRSSEPLGGASKELWQELTREKDLEKEDLAKLSRNSKLVRDPSSGHHIQTDNPALVVSAIEQVVESVRNGTHQVAADWRGTAADSQRRRCPRDAIPYSAINKGSRLHRGRGDDRTKSGSRRRRAFSSRCPSRLVERS